MSQLGSFAVALRTRLVSTYNQIRAFRDRGDNSEPAGGVAVYGNVSARNKGKWTVTWNLLGTIEMSTHAIHKLAKPDYGVRPIAVGTFV